MASNGINEEDSSSSEDYVAKAKGNAFGRGIKPKSSPIKSINKNKSRKVKNDNDDDNNYNDDDIDATDEVQTTNKVQSVIDKVQSGSVH